MDFCVSLGLLACLCACAVPAAMAEEKSPGGASDALSASGGIVSPGGPTAVFQNPAGLVLNNAKFSVTAQAGASDSFNNPFLRAGLMGGGTSFQLAGGLTQTTSNPSSTSIFYGMGVSPGGGFSLGVGGQTGISRAGGTTINAGALYQGSLPVRLGLTAMGLGNGISEWGAGVSGRVSGLFELLLDGAYNPGSKGVGLKPGVKVGNAEAALTLSYGFADAASTIELADGFTAGGSVKFGSASLQLYYNDLAKFYAAVTFSL